MIPRFPGEGPRDLTKPLEQVKLLCLPEHAGERLDVVLTEFLHWRSRTSVLRLIKGGFVDLRERTTRKGAVRVHDGDVIVVRVPASPEPVTVAPEGFDIPILHEDRWCVVVDKPAGLAVHPAGKQVYGTLIHHLHCRYRRPDDPAHDVVPRLLHRIDRETSGVVAVGLDESFHGFVRCQFEQRQVHKTYQAVVHGRPSPANGRIEFSIGPARRSAIRLRLEARSDGTGLSALTDYRTLRSNARFSLVEMTPLTGRTHQLRVHMTAIGCPLVGDKIYGVEDEVFLKHLQGELSTAQRERLILDRHALHSSRLRFDHPHVGPDFEVVAPLPNELDALVE